MGIHTSQDLVTPRTKKYRESVSLVGTWTEVNSDSMDASTSTNTLAGAVAGTTATVYEVQVAGQGTHILVRHKFDGTAGSAYDTSPVVHILSFDPSGYIGKLVNQNGSVDFTMDDSPDAATDASAVNYTVPTDATVGDLRGASTVLVAVHTAAAAGTGDLTEGSIEVKVV